MIIYNLGSIISALARFLFSYTLSDL